jgi:hypothetical protein
VQTISLSPPRARTDDDEPTVQSLGGGVGAGAAPGKPHFRLASPPLVLASDGPSPARGAGSGGLVSPGARGEAAAGATAVRRADVRARATPDGEDHPGNPD